MTNLTYILAYYSDHNKCISHLNLFSFQLWFRFNTEPASCCILLAFSWLLVSPFLFHPLYKKQGLERVIIERMSSLSSKSYKTIVCRHWFELTIYIIIKNHYFFFSAFTIFYFNCIVSWVVCNIFFNCKIKVVNFRAWCFLFRIFKTHADII